MAYNSNGFEIIEVEGGSIDVVFVCSRDQVECSMNKCEANCHRYYSCDQIAEANDELVKKGY